MSAMGSALFAQQSALQRWLQHGDIAIVPLVRDVGHEARLRVYADAYRLRLIEVLGNDFPVLRARIGDEDLADWGEAYLRTHPSPHKSVRWFGRDFPEWLQGTDPLAAQLARFEWQQGEAFDSADAPELGLDIVAALPASRWPSLRLHLQPALRLLRLPASVPALANAFNRGETLPELCNDDPADWLLWRKGLQVHWRRLGSDEAELLQQVRAGATFSQLCDRLAKFHADVPLRAAGLLKRWLNEGLVASIEHEEE